MISSQTAYKTALQKYLLCCGAFFTFLFLFFPIIFFITDPLQVFHKSWFQSGEYLDKDMRIQAAGIIESYDFDSIILGTSIFENTSANEAGNLFKCTFFNLSMSGSSYYERALVLSKSLSKGLKYVIYSLDDVYLTCWTENTGAPTKNWGYLYEDNFINKFRIYFQKKYILHPFNPLANLRKTNLDAPNAWSKKTANNDFAKKRFDADILKFQKNDLPKGKHNNEIIHGYSSLNKKRLAKAIAYFDTYVIKYIKQFPQTTFHLVFPPYSRFKYADWLHCHPEDYLLHQDVIRHMTTIAKELPNMHIYGFEDTNLPDNISYYTDSVHYQPVYNSYIVRSISAGKHKLTFASVDEYLAKSRNYAEKFDIAQLKSIDPHFINTDN